MTGLGRLRQQGFALLLVLWTVVLLAFLVTRMTATGRSETRLALNLRTAAVAEAAADGAVHEAVFHLLANSAEHWPASGAEHIVTMTAARATVRMDSEAGKINPNSAQPELLQALLHRLGVDTGTAHSIAAAIVGWRFPGNQAGSGGTRAQYVSAGQPVGPPGAPFESLDELGLVLGMTPDLLAQLAPHLTLYHEGEPDPTAADTVVLAALQEATGVRPVGSGRIDETVVSITATAIADAGSRFTRRAIVRTGAGSADGGSLYAILSWQAVTE